MFGDTIMKRWIVSILIRIAGTAPVIPDATATPNYNEPIPELFDRISPSVVLISAIAIDPDHRDNNRGGCFHDKKAFVCKV